jgi:hypothetical protein
VVAAKAVAEGERPPRPGRPSALDVMVAAVDEEVRSTIPCLRTSPLGYVLFLRAFCFVMVCNFKVVGRGCEHHIHMSAQGQRTVFLTPRFKPCFLYV